MIYGTFDNKTIIIHAVNMLTYSVSLLDAPKIKFNVRKSLVSEIRPTERYISELDTKGFVK
jgi:hypothetical protein